MGRLLVLTSPLMKGKDVEAFQRSLTKNGYYHDPLDGFYGELTAQASFRAKYWLGYRHPDHVAGDRLYGYLMGRERPAWMKLIAKRRRAAMPKVTHETKVLEIAHKYIGVKENPPGSNHQQFGIWYGFDRAPWCDMFVTYVEVTAGSHAFKRGRDYSFVPNMDYDARMGRNNLTLSHPLIGGDIVTFDWNHDGRPDHTGFFVKWLDEAHTKFASIEGNTSATSNSNGGEVCYREDRFKSEVHSFIHVGA